MASPELTHVLLINILSILGFFLVGIFLREHK